MKNNMNQLVTIITVCYNAEMHIEKTLQSVIFQNNSLFEYLIIDGGSNDRTIEIICRYIPLLIQKGIVVKLISEKDNGIYDAMNKGARLSSGEWISFMNAGDIFYDYNTVNQVIKMLTNCSADVFYGNAIGVFKDREKFLQANKAFWCKYRMSFCHQASFTRRDLLLKLAFNEQYRISADFDLFMRAKLQGAKFQKSNYIISKYLQEDGVSADYKKLVKENNTILKKNGMKDWNLFVIYVKLSKCIHMRIFTYLGRFKRSVLSKLRK